MVDKEIHLRNIALGVCDHLPLDREDALKVLDYTRALIDWRERGLHGLSPADADAA